MNRRTKYGWMALGGLLVLFGVVLACKFQNGNRLAAQTEPTGPRLDSPDPTKKVMSPVDETSRLLPPIGSQLPEIRPMSASADPGLPTPPAPALPGAQPGPLVAPAPLPTLEERATPVPAPALPAPGTQAPVPQALPTPGILPAAAALPPLGSDPRPILIPASGGGTPPSPGLAPLAPAPIPPSAAPPAPGATPPLPPAPLDVPPPPASTRVEAPPSPPGRVEVPAPYPAPPSQPSPPQPTPPTNPQVVPAPGEPPLAPPPGPVQTYRVRESGETLKSISRRTLGSAERVPDVCRLNPTVKPETTLVVGTLVRLPGDACVQDDSEPIKPLPSLRPRTAVKPKVVLPLTGTFQVNLDDHKVMTLPRAMIEQLGNCDTVLVSPGPDKCLWLTNNAHLDRLTQRLDSSPAREIDLRVFKRLYYAQTVKVSMKDGRVALSDRLAAFAGLHQEVVLVGIDDHFEIWDAAKWRRYTETKKATPIDAE